MVYDSRVACVSLCAAEYDTEEGCTSIVSLITGNVHGLRYVNAIPEQHVFHCVLRSMTRRTQYFTGDDAYHTPPSVPNTPLNSRHG